MLRHRFWDICPDPNALFKESNTIRSFMYRATKQFEQVTGSHSVQSMGLSSQPYVPSIAGVEKARYVGDAFEALVEALLLFSSTDNRIGIEEYRILEDCNIPDMGVDGVGIYQNRPCVVQVKYLSDTTAYLSYKNNLGNFGNQGTLLFSEYPRSEIDFVVITNCKGVNHKIVEHGFGNKLRVLDGKDLKRFIDGNTSYWNKLQAEVANVGNTVTP